MGKSKELIHFNVDVVEKHRCTSHTTCQSVSNEKTKENNASPLLAHTFYGTNQPNTLLTVEPDRNFIWIGRLNQRTTVDIDKQYVKDIFPDKSMNSFELKCKNKVRSFDLSVDELLNLRN